MATIPKEEGYQYRTSLPHFHHPIAISFPNTATSSSQQIINLAARTLTLVVTCSPTSSPWRSHLPRKP